MSEVNRDHVIALYKEIYTNLQTEANDNVLKSLNEAIAKNPEATYTQVISSLKVYTLSVIESMLKQSVQPQGETNESKTE